VAPQLCMLAPYMFDTISLERRYFKLLLVTCFFLTLCGRGIVRVRLLHHTDQ
jgi:hypothetical protein